jgi:GNAT superfamily N-acetyltransferase
MSEQRPPYELRPAGVSDVDQLGEIARAAYAHYVERIGMVPRPMTDDYAEVVRGQQVTVADSGGVLVGYIVLAVTDEGFVIDNVAVHPSRRGTGLGRVLLEFAEAEAARNGFESIYLYTHEKMAENLTLYTRIGYVEFDRRSMGDFSLVYLRKQLNA